MKIVRLAGALAALLCAGPLAAQNAQELLRKMDFALEPDAYHAVMEISTVKPGRTTTMKIDDLYKRGVGTFMEILAPARVKGTRFLQKEGGLWMYSPQSDSNRPLRLSPELPFQGSVFSNGDVSEPHYSRDYLAALGGTETLVRSGLGTVHALILVCTPQTPRAQYSQIRAWIQPETAVPLQLEYTAKSGLLFKRMVFSQYKILAGELRPSVYRMESFEDTSTVSTSTIDSMEARPDLPDGQFSDAALTR